MSEAQGPAGREIDRYLITLTKRYEAERGRALELDWAQLAPALERSVWSGMLVNTLLYRLGEAPLKLNLPNRAALDCALSAGLAFALANRAGTIELDGFSEAPALLCSSAWRRNWTPATRSAWVGLLGESPAGLGANGNGHNGHRDIEGVEQLFSGNRAMFVNPHRSRRSGSSESAFPLISRWLSATMIQYKDDDEARVWRAKVLAAVRVLLDELIQNVRGHATSRRGDPVFSLVKIEISDGDSPRAQIVVQDTGPGIVATLKPKLKDDEMPEEELMVELFRGTLPSWHRARNIGLPKVWRTCRQLGAELTLASGSVRLSGPVGDEDFESRLGEFEAPGVVVNIDLPLLPTS